MVASHESLNPATAGLAARRRSCDGAQHAPARAYPALHADPNVARISSMPCLLLDFSPLFRTCEITNGPLAGMFIPRSVSIAPESDAAPEPTVCLN